MKNIIILTGTELRHDFFRKYISSCDGINVINSYCEGTENNLTDYTESIKVGNELRINHLNNRLQSERDFFELYSSTSVESSSPIFLKKGDINNPEYVNKIINSEPDLIISYGCSIIKEQLISAFKGRFINVHLGLSPYYKGGGTNFWPLVNGEPEYVGATFMHIDTGIDTGEVIHQIRARFDSGDTPVQIGNRLILDMARSLSEIVVAFDRLTKEKQLDKLARHKTYRKNDYSEDSVVSLYKNFKDGMIQDYLLSINEKCACAPIISNKGLAK